MDKLKFNRFAISSFGFVFLLFFSPSSFRWKKPDKPNFLIIFTDDQTYRAIGYNNNLVHTPNLDRLARQGLIFNQAFAATPICAASRASILTGLYPQTNGTVGLNSDAFINTVVKDKTYKTLAHFLTEVGYTTYFSGKSHLGNPLRYGFQLGSESKDVTDAEAFNQVSDFINDGSFGKKPFLIWMAPRQPHVPLKPAKEWINLYTDVDIPLEPNFREKPPRESFYNQGLPGENFYRDSDFVNNYKNLSAGPPRSPQEIKEFTKAYYATISHLDFQIGKLIQQLQKGGHLKNTVIIFLSDNGYFLGNHGLGNKITMHEESVRVPFFMYWDGIKGKGKRINEIISSVDVLPTVLDLAGAGIPNYLHGKSLKNTLTGTSLANVHDYVVSECIGVGGILGAGHRMVRTEEWKYILSDINDEALFNMKDDPHELNNVIDKEQQPILSTLKQYLREWKTLVGDNKEYR